MRTIWLLGDPEIFDFHKTTKEREKKEKVVYGVASGNEAPNKMVAGQVEYILYNNFFFEIWKNIVEKVLSWSFAKSEPFLMKTGW